MLKQKVKEVKILTPLEKRIDVWKKTKEDCTRQLNEMEDKYLQAKEFNQGMIELCERKLDELYQE